MQFITYAANGGLFIDQAGFLRSSNPLGGDGINLPRSYLFINTKDEELITAMASNPAILPSQITTRHRTTAVGWSLRVG